mmetsp:Transcript_9030/g.29950  ORF Transcript_9030/g.29950 Transcript_9030/m.29950 type:complete len:224 (-) Transcript_9030:1039-1710(-)
MRPGRMSAGSSFSGWLVVMMKMRPGVSTTPSSTFRRPARLSSSDVSSSMRMSRSLLLLGSEGGSRSPAAITAAIRLSSCSAWSGSGFGLTHFADAGAAAGSSASGAGAPACNFACAGVTAGAPSACDDSRVTFSTIVPLPLGSVRVYSTVVLVVALPGRAGMRRWTMCEAASTSSITNTTSSNVSDAARSCPTTASLRSYMRSISCWLVLSRESGMLIMERPM